MNPLLLVAAGLGIYYFFVAKKTDTTTTVANTVKNTKDTTTGTLTNAVRAGEIPSDTSSSDVPAAQYHVWTDADLTLKANPTGKPVQIYTYNGADVYVSEHTLSKTLGQPLESYSGFTDAGKMDHFRTMVDGPEIDAVSAGTKASCSFWIAASTSEPACLALYNHLRKYDPQLRLCASS